MGGWCRNRKIGSYHNHALIIRGWFENFLMTSKGLIFLGQSPGEVLSFWRFTSKLFWFWSDLTMSCWLSAERLVLWTSCFILGVTTVLYSYQCWKCHSLSCPTIGIKHGPVYKNTTLRGKRNATLSFSLYRYLMSRITRKPVFWVSNQVWHKPGLHPQKIARGMKFLI